MPPFTPRNRLEEQLLQAEAGAVSPDAFLKGLMDTQVFMPVEDQQEIGGFQHTRPVRPLTLATDTGAVLALFSSPERAKTVLAAHPGYGGGLLLEFRRALGYAEGLGIALNPGQDVGFELEPDSVAGLKQ